MPALLRFHPFSVRRPRRTIRLRLSLLYSGLFLVAGAALLAVTYVLVRWTFPTASIHTYASTQPPASAQPGGSTTPGHPLAQLPSLATLQLQDARQRGADLHHLLIVSGGALMVMALVSLVLGWLVAGRVLRPLRAITATVQDISSTNLHRRLALSGPDDELKELGETFDALLGRLQQSFQSQRQFVANASHELRTPLTLERALLEAAMTDPDATAASLRATCGRVLASNGQQERLIEALLTLATSERGLERGESLELGEMAEHILVLRRTEARRAGLEIRTSLEAAPTLGDIDLVERLVTNLIDNAMRYNVPGGWIEVVTRTDGSRSTLRVSNPGPAIPASEISLLCQPFHRLGHRRAAPGEGFGLGLSVVAAVAAAHHAALDVGARPEGGLDVQVAFPTQSRDESLSPSMPAKTGV